jgi:hypothetical protein
MISHDTVHLHYQHLLVSNLLLYMFSRGILSLSIFYGLETSWFSHPLLLQKQRNPYPIPYSKLHHTTLGATKIALFLFSTLFTCSVLIMTSPSESTFQVLWV